MSNILIIDDEADIRDLISDILKDEGYSTRVACNASTAINEIEALCPDAVILDIWLEGSEFDGIGVLKKIKELHPSLPVIMISGHGNIETAVQTIRLGAYDFIEKPFKAEKLLILLDRAVSSYVLTKQNEELKKATEINSNYIGTSKPSISLIQAAETVAVSNSRVLICGEPGTGKEVLARFIHKHSARAGREFIKLHAANIREDKFEEELFGLDLEQGRKNGLLDKANGGTLYIDEISEMPLIIQNKFLKVLQESGGTKKYNIRIIASSSKDLLGEIKKGKLNQSLYYRINVVPIEITPLKERKSDIPVLINYFIDNFSQVLGVGKISLTKETFGVLELYDWPGNIRQLKNTIEWLMIMHAKQKSEIDIGDLPTELVPNRKAANNNLINPNLFLRSLKEARDEFEKVYLAAQLSRFSGNISKTAEFIDMDRTALHRKLKLLNIV